MAQNKIQYGERIDPVIYSPATSEFTQEDWLELAEAARDQAAANKPRYLCSCGCGQEVSQMGGVKTSLCLTRTFLRGVRI